MKRPAILAVVIAVLGIGVSLVADAQGPIRIGASLSLTGTYAKLGKNQHEGYQLCQKELNAKGGLLGRKVEFVVYDDQSMPPTGVRLYEKLITEDKVDAVMGPYSSAITEAVVNVTEKYKKVMVAPLAATTSIFKKEPRRKYVFMIVSPAEVYLEVDQQELIRDTEEVSTKLAELLKLGPEHLRTLIKTFKSRRPQETTTSGCSRAAVPSRSQAPGV